VLFFERENVFLFVIARQIVIVNISVEVEHGIAVIHTCFWLCLFYRKPSRRNKKVTELFGCHGLNSTVEFTKWNTPLC